MSNTNFNSELDMELMEALMAEPEEAVIKKTNPLKIPFILLLAGIGLTSLRLNIWHLSELGGLLGDILMIIGFGRLRKENKYFRTGLVLSAAIIVWSLINTVLNTSIYTKNIIDGDLSSGIMLAVAVAGVLRVGAFCGGITKIYHKNNQKTRNVANILLFVWYLVLAVAAYTNTIWEWGYGRELPFKIFWAVLVVSFVVIVYAEKKFIERLDDNVGYSVKVDAKPAVFAIVLGVVVMVAAIAGVAVGYKYGHSYEMNFHQAEAPASKAEEIRANLVKLGMPENVVADIQDEDILKSEGASRVFIGDCSFEIEDGVKATSYLISFDDKQEFVSYMYYTWEKEMDCFGTNALNVYTSLSTLESVEQGGAVMYDVNDLTMVSKYNSIEREIDKFGEVPINCYAFSYEEGGSNYRGYTAEKYVVVGDAFKGAIALPVVYDLFHEKNVLSYPAVGAKELAEAKAPIKNVFPLYENFYTTQFSGILNDVE